MSETLPSLCKQFTHVAWHMPTRLGKRLEQWWSPTNLPARAYSTVRHFGAVCDRRMSADMSDTLPSLYMQTVPPCQVAYAYPFGEALRAMAVTHQFACACI